MERRNSVRVPDVDLHAAVGDEELNGTATGRSVRDFRLFVASFESFGVAILDPREVAGCKV